jgi:hypothetical protein
MGKRYPAAIFIMAAAIIILLWRNDCEGGLVPGELVDQKVAVVVYPQNSAAGRYVKTALSCIEGILLDNDITALAAIYLYVAVAPGLADYYTASAHADIRFIEEKNARVTAISLTPMGAPGRPPSDGLTQNSAAINAVQRAVDEACENLGMENMDPATPRAVRLDLRGPLDTAGMRLDPCGKEGGRELAAYARLEQQKWRGEKVTCTALAPAGALGAVAGYIIDTDFRRRP